jgi:hypothetical protein
MKGRKKKLHLVLLQTRQMEVVEQRKNSRSVPDVQHMFNVKNQAIYGIMMLQTGIWYYKSVW